jgi:hypothetical protein
LVSSINIKKISRPDADTNTGRIKLDAGEAGHRQCIGNLAMPGRDAPIVLDAEQHMGGLALVGNEYRPL